MTETLQERRVGLATIDAEQADLSAQTGPRADHRRLGPCQQSRERLFGGCSDSPFWAFGDHGSAIAKKVAVPPPRLNSSSLNGLPSRGRIGSVKTPKSAVDRTGRPRRLGPSIGWDRRSSVAPRGNLSLNVTHCYLLGCDESVPGKPRRHGAVVSTYLSSASSPRVGFTRSACGHGLTSLMAYGVLRYRHLRRPHGPGTRSARSRTLAKIVSVASTLHALRDT